jgi:two-component system, cell cycle sensor histidine kinase and response regulator CckA
MELPDSSLSPIPLGAHCYALEESGELIFIGGNPAAYRILGRDHADLVGRRIEDAFPSVAGTPLPGILRRIASSGGVHEEELTFRDGRVGGVYEIDAYQPAAGRVTVLFRDVTERVRVEGALRAKGDELDRYFMASLDLLCIADMDGRFLRLNPEWERALGWPIGEMEGREYLELVHPEDLERTRAVMARLAAQEEVLDFVNRLQCRDGSHRWIEWRAFPKGRLVYATARDITQRVLMEKALRENEERTASIFRASPVGIGVSAGRRVTEANDRLLELTGRSREELIGMPTRSFYADEAEYERVGIVLGQAERETGYGAAETRWMRRDGSMMDVILGTARLPSVSRESSVTFSVLDITERNSMERERRALETRMEQTQKLESLGVLAGGIAHDFNNILMAILGHAELARDDVTPHSRAQESLQEIERAARRAADLCRQMLAYSGRGRFVIQPLDLPEVVDEMAQMLEVSISKKAVLRVVSAGPLPPVQADVAQIRQVVMNLAINASEAIGDAAGVITITMGTQECDAACLMSGAVADAKLPPGRYVFLEVTDTGCGMDEGTCARIFEPFFTTKFAGRGLGLAAVIGIVRGHRGAVKVTSEPGRGSTFRVLFPAAPGEARKLDAGAGDGQAWQGSGTVLFADDEEGVRVVGGRMLERMGFRVILAVDGSAALEEFRAHREEITCVIMDLTMPRMDGEEAFREMRRLDPGVRVLLSSGFNEQEAIQRFVGKGIAGFIQKPYQLAALGEQLRKILRG